MYFLAWKTPPPLATFTWRSLWFEKNEKILVGWGRMFPRKFKGWSKSFIIFFFNLGGHWHRRPSESDRRPILVRKNRVLGYARVHKQKTLFLFLRDVLYLYCSQHLLFWPLQNQLLWRALWVRLKQREGFENGHLALSAKKNQITVLIQRRNGQNGKILPRKDFVFWRVLALTLFLNTSQRILNTVIS